VANLPFSYFSYLRDRGLQQNTIMAQESPIDSEELLSSLFSKCQNLLSELQQFQDFLASHKRQGAVELRQFKSSINSELKSLEKLRHLNELESKKAHSLRSSNLPFYEAVWTTAKRCRGLVAIGRRVCLDGLPPSHLSSADSREKNGSRASRSDIRSKKKSVVVDIVAQGGEEWIKVSTVTETRLGFEIAKKGWEAGISSGDESDDGDHARGHEEEDREVELLRLAADLKMAASAIKVRYKHPSVRFVLQKIVEGRVREVDKILQDVRNTGAIVECGIAEKTAPNHPHRPASLEDLRNDVFSAVDIAKASWDGVPHKSSSDLEVIFNRLLPPTHPDFTPTVNVDCTLLLAIISDLSNLLPSSIPSSPAHHRAITRQMELEGSEPLLSTYLWPAMGSRKLVCTHEAAKRMREITLTIGTKTERERMWLLMGERDCQGLKGDDLIDGFQSLSEYQVPPEWNLPITEVESQNVISAAFENGDLPLVAKKVERRLTDINRSVFVYGWATGIMTLSSNRTVVKMIETVVGEELGEIIGPRVWVCGTARSLVGKEKGKHVE
jgi:hypothetical protein